MYLIFAASVLLCSWGLLSFVLVLLLGLPSWLWCLVRCGFWGCWTLPEIKINKSICPACCRAFLGSWCNCARLDLPGLLGVFLGFWCPL